MAGIFSFSTSAAQTSTDGIRSVMGQIKNTINDIANDVDTLLGDWAGSESDLYSGANNDWRTAAHQINDMLEQVAKALDEVDSGNTKIRDEVRSALDQMN